MFTPAEKFKNDILTINCFDNDSDPEKKSFKNLRYGSFD